MVLCEQLIIVLHGLKTRHVCNEPAVVNRLCISYLSPSVIQGQVTGLYIPTFVYCLYANLIMSYRCLINK